MSEVFVTDKLGLQHFRFVLDTYVETVRRLKKEIPLMENKHPREQYVVLTDVQYQALIQHEIEFRQEKLIHIQQKAKAVVNEFINKRSGLNIILTYEEINGRLFIKGSCPMCHAVINVIDAIVWDEPKHRLGLRCPSCNAERWLIG